MINFHIQFNPSFSNKKNKNKFTFEMKIIEI